jgi:hypothetical protein
VNYLMVGVLPAFVALTAVNNLVMATASEHEACSI